MRLLLLAIFLASPAAVDHQHIDIPVAYRGTWALKASLCKDKELGPAFVHIGPRRISFYEDFGYLSVAQLNEVGDPPEFFGRFIFVNNLRFRDEAIRLDMQAGKMLVTLGANDPDALPSKAEWFRCSTEEAA